jgi:hypothetical protein
VEDPRLRETVIAFSKKATADGFLIEAGWLGLRLACIPDDAPQLQLDEMRQAFFAGAQHLFGSIMNILDPDEEPTAADMIRLDQINDELNRFIEEFSRKHGIEVP